MDINEAKSAMAEAGEEQKIVLKAEMVELLSDLDGHERTVKCTDPGDQNTIFYIARSIIYSIRSERNLQHDD